MHVYIIIKSIMDNEDYVQATGKIQGGYKLRSKSVRQVFSKREDAEKYLMDKMHELKEQGMSVYKWENEKVIEGYRNVRDYRRLFKYEIDIQEVK